MSRDNRYIKVTGDGFHSKVELHAEGAIVDLSHLVSRVDFVAEANPERNGLPRAVIEVLCPRAEFVALVRNVEFTVVEPS